MPDKGWQRRFDDPIPMPRGRPGHAARRPSYTEADALGYHANDWAQGGPNGYLEYLKTQRPDVQRRASELFAPLGPRIRAVEADFAKRYGWTN
jgi:hypothetical protein